MWSTVSQHCSYEASSSSFGQVCWAVFKMTLMYFKMRSVLGRNLHADQNLWDNRELNFSERLFSRKPLFSHEETIWRFYCISLLTDLLYYFYWLIYESYSVIRKPVIFFHRNQISQNENEDFFENKHIQLHLKISSTKVSSFKVIKVMFEVYRLQTECFTRNNSSRKRKIGGVRKPNYKTATDSLRDLRWVVCHSAKLRK